MGRLTTAIFVCLLVPAAVSAQTRIEKNVIYGMYSGLALLMDVHRPETTNGLGIIYVSGSGWQAPLGYDAAGLKDGVGNGDWISTLLRAGYTVFTINHRAAPRFHYPAAIDDVQRAIRFVRHHARQFDIDGRRLGGFGGSSGAHLVGLAAMLAAPGLADDADPVNREPATLQAVVVRAGPHRFDTDAGWQRGDADGGLHERHPAGSRAAARISTSSAGRSLQRISKRSLRRHHSRTSLASSPPVLLLHGDADTEVPFQQAVAMEAALRAVNVPTKLVRLSGGGHGATFPIDGRPNGKPHPGVAERSRRDGPLAESALEMSNWLGDAEGAE